MNNFVKRTLSGAVFVTVVIGSVLLNQYAYVGMMVVVLVWAMLEYYDIVIKDRVHTNKIIGVLCGVAVFAAGFFYAQGIVSVSGKIFLFLIPIVVLLFISQLYSTDHYSFRAIAYTISGVAYIALPLALCNGLAFPEGHYERGILLGFFILLWANDTFAYLTGIMFGKHRLFERISPKKSWEGFFGGLICTIALSLLVARLFPIFPDHHHWMAIAAIIVVFGVYGDLIESLLKRNLKIKDSGHFLPGHGGILDRFDSVLLAAPMVFFYLKAIVF